MEKIIVFKALIFNRLGINPSLSRLLSCSGTERIQWTIKDAPEVLALEDNVCVKPRPFKLERRWPFFRKPWSENQVIPWGAIELVLIKFGMITAMEPMLPEL